jgi:hypothetical protein
VTGVTVSETGSIFVNVPRCSEDLPVSVAEVARRTTKPYPNDEWNTWRNLRMSEVSPEDHQKMEVAALKRHVRSTLHNRHRQATRHVRSCQRPTFPNSSNNAAHPMAKPNHKRIHSGAVTTEAIIARHLAVAPFTTRWAF